jgi:quinol monooxygenase YgiN
MQLREMDDRVSLLEQVQEDGGRVVLINQFNMAPADAGRFLEAWADDAAFMKQQPGFVSAQLHRGTAGSTTFVNVAVWESARALGQALGSPEFQARVARYPGQHRRGPARLHQGRRPRHLRGLNPRPQRLAPGSPADGGATAVNGVAGRTRPSLARFAMRTGLLRSQGNAASVVRGAAGCLLTVTG